MRSRFDPWLALSIVLLGALGVQGVWSGFADFPDAGTRLQFISSITQFGYGILALLAIPALLVAWRGFKTVLRLWLLAITITGGLAPVAWGEASVWTGIAAATLTLVIGLVIIWVVRRAQVTP